MGYYINLENISIYKYTEILKSADLLKGKLILLGEALNLLVFSVILLRQL